MGLSNSEKRTFVSLVDGKFRLKTTADNPLAIMRTNKNNEQVYELCYDQIKGHIRDIVFSEHQEFGKKVTFLMVDDSGDRYSLDLSLASGATSSLLMTLPNLDPEKEVTIRVWSKVVDGKSKTRLYPSQPGKEKIDWYWTKEDPKGLPKMEKKKVKGKEVWDDSERIEFLEDYITKNIAPRFRGSIATTEVEHSYDPPEPIMPEDEDSDLTF